MLSVFRHFLEAIVLMINIYKYIFFVFILK